MPGVIIHGNSLSTEAWGGWVTSRSYVWGGSIAHELTADQAREWIVGPLRAASQPEEVSPDRAVNAQSAQAEPAGPKQAGPGSTGAVRPARR